MAGKTLIDSVVHLARKRSLLDRPGCARLAVLMQAAGIATVEAARRFVLGPAGIDPLMAQRLVEHLPQPDQVTFGAYTPYAHLADGGMGSVWLAGDADDRLVVVKTMRGNLAGNKEVAHRFERETRYMMEIRHPRVVHCLDHGAAEDGTLFMVLEFEPSGDLRELVAAEGLLPEALALAIVHQVADGLGEAHRRQLIHRDIKPANIFCDREGRAKLADFGIARSTADTRTMLTMQGALVGSPFYMSPEQVVAAADLDIRSDIYALGAVLYYLLAGQDPYRGTLNEVLHAHRTAPVPDVTQVRPDVHPATIAVIAKAMAKKREQRYAEPAAMLADVAAALAGLGRQGAPSLEQVAVHEANTMTADLSGGEDAPAGGSDSVATVAFPSTDTEATAAPAPAPTATSAVTTRRIQEITLDRPDPAWAEGPTSPALVPRPRPQPRSAGGEAMEGDLATAITSPWLVLMLADGTPLSLYARTQLLVGKLCEPPVDLCLRKYPIAQWREDCLKISRQHLRLRYDAGLSRPLLTDLGSGNGTFLDGQRLAINETRPLDPGRTHRCNVAGVLDLDLKPIPRARPPIASLRGVGSEAGQHDCGLDRDHQIDALVISRLGNRPQMASALVLRRLSLGGAGSDLPVAGASTICELALFHGRWLHRSGGDRPWSPLAGGTRLDLGGSTALAGPGHYQIFQDG